MTGNGAPKTEPERLADRLDALAGTASSAERSLATARQAMKEIADICDVEVPDDPSRQQYEDAKKAAARAEVSLDAAADELDRMAAALRAAAGNQENGG